MKKGFVATLFAAAVSFAGTQSAFAIAPVISGLPDITIGDAEAADNPLGTDNNLFIFTNAFRFSDKVSDADTADNLLLWSFGEYDVPGSPIPAGQYRVNGVGPVNVGDAQIAADQAGTKLAPNAKNPGAFKINVAHASNGNNADYASLRDVFYSPTSGSVPFAGKSDAVDDYAKAGRPVRFYVADQDANLTSDTVIIKTVDGGLDAVSSSFIETFRQTGPFTNWVYSEIANDADVSGAQTATSLNVQVNENAINGYFRIGGWRNNNVMPYSAVGTANAVRAKFYVYASNPTSDPLNKVPNFRIRLHNSDAVISVNDVEYARTGNTGPTGDINIYPLTDNPAAETRAGRDLRPSANPAKPSLYRLDFDPVDVPALAGTNIEAVFESYAFNDPAVGTLSLAEAVVGTYPALTDADGTEIFKYERAQDADPKFAFNAGGFTAKNDFTFGRRQELYLSEATQPVSGHSTAGITFDTLAVRTDRFGVIQSSVTYADNTLKPRISAGKLYRARFHTTSNVATGVTTANTTPIQGTLRWRVQAAAQVFNARLEVNSALTARTAADVNKDISMQVLPGTGSQNPDKDASIATASQNGGWYTVLMNSPLDMDIRGEHAGTTIAARMPALSAEAGPGSATADTFRNIELGIDGVKQPATLLIGAATFPWAGSQPNNANTRTERIRLTEHNQIDDGGYGY